MNVMQRAAAIGRLQEMAERLPDGSFDRLAVNAAVGDMMLQIPGAVKFGGGAWRCFQCGAAVQPKANYCSHCGKRLEWPASGEMPADENQSYRECFMSKFMGVR